MKYSIKTKLTLIISFIVLIAVVSITFIANVVIEKQFNLYITKQQENKKRQIVNSLIQQYDIKSDSWNEDFIHSIGMSALYDGYIIKINDINQNTIWDAESHNMSLCEQVMKDVKHRMEKVNPNGDITTETYPMSLNNKMLGTVNITYFGPFFFSENDFEFVSALNTVFIIIGILALLFSAIIGVITAKRLAEPILKTVEVTKKIADGNYDTRLNEKANTIEIDRLIHSINLLGESLKRQETLRKQLTEDISHELRTPISILQTHLEAMIEGVWPSTKEKLEGCNDEVKRIGSLINDLEKLAIADSGNINLNKSSLNLTDIINQALNAFCVKIQEKNINVTVTGNSPNILADSNRISQVVVNLISNAIKYTDVNGVIEIRIFETHNYSCFSIQDNGIGIPENEIPYIFERFYRTDKSRTRKTGGSGLGLSIVKSIIEAHKGKIEVYSEINKGSIFTIMLPK